MRNKLPKMHDAGSPRRHPGMTLLCLFAVIVQIALPTIHIVGEQWGEGSRPGVSVAWTHAGGMEAPVLESAPISAGSFDHRRHTPDSCPICQAILLAHNCRTGSASTCSALPGPVDLIVFDRAHRIISGIFSFDCNPRSPPCFV
ncbi:MAG: hypothetical protein WAW37_10685 [Syntrophobacteraceae bacterium]